MIGYIIRRLIWVVLVVLAVTLVAYTIFFVLPSTDPAVAFAGRNPTPELVAEVRQQLGLDKPVPVQYGLYVKRLVLGDQYGWPGLGLSYNTRSPVRDEIFKRASITLQLAIGGAILWLLIGIPIGVFSALKRRSAADRASMGFALCRGLGARLLARAGGALHLLAEARAGCRAPGTCPSPTARRSGSCT